MAPPAASPSSSRPGEGTPRPMRFTGRRLVALLITVVVVSFVAQNRDSVRIEIFFLDAQLPLWLALTVTALLGVTVGLLLKRRR